MARQKLQVLFVHLNSYFLEGYRMTNFRHDTTVLKDKKIKTGFSRRVLVSHRHETLLSFNNFHYITLGLILILLTSQPVSAGLGSRSGQTELQSVTGTAVQTVCGGLTTTMATTPLTTLQNDLFSRCGELVQTANDLDGTGATGNSLGLSEAELAAGIQQVAIEEAANARTLASKTITGQMRNLGGRLAALRAGAQGFAMGTLPFDASPNSRTMTAGTAFGRNGGGASADASSSFSRLGGFMNGIFGFGDMDATSREDGFDFNTQGVTLGADYRFSDSMVLGGAFGYTRFDSTFDTTATAAGGDQVTNGYNVSIYGTYYLKDFYVDGAGTFGWTDHDLTRRIVYASNSALPGQNRTATSDTNSQQYSFNVGAGYNAHVGPYEFGPYGQLNYMHFDIDGYEETGAMGLNLVVADQNLESLITNLGLRVSRSMGWSNGVFIPLIRGEWDHEFKNNSEIITARYVNDPGNNSLIARSESPDRNFFKLGVSLLNVFIGGTQAFIDFETLLGFRDLTNHVFTIGGRHEF